jgi:hypothetical protein
MLTEDASGATLAEYGWGIAAFWLQDRREDRERFILKIKRLPTVDRGKAGAIDGHVTRFVSETWERFFGPGIRKHSSGVSRCPLNLLHRRRCLSAPDRVPVE